MVIPSFRPLFTGRGEFLLKLSKSLQNKGHRVVILTAKRSKHLPENELIEGVAIIRLWSGLRFYFVGFGLSLICYFIRNAHKYDVVHLHTYVDAFLIPIIIAKLFKKMTIYDMSLIGSDDPLTTKNRKFGRLRFKLLSLCNFFVGISSPMIELSLEAGIPKNKLYLIYRGTDMRKYSPVDVEQKNKLRLKLDLPLNCKLVSFVGSVIHRKGIDLLIDVWDYVSKKVPDALLIIIGVNKFQNSRQNAYVELMREKIKAYRIEDKVKMVGRQDNVYEYLQCSDLFVFTSRCEGFATALVEAMGCGLPLVTSNYNQIPKRDIIEDDKTGYTIDGENYVEFGDVILSILLDPLKKQQFGQNARIRALKYFDIDIITNQYLKLYNQNKQA